MKFALRHLLPLSLIVMGVVLLAGCIWLPISEHSSDWKYKDPRPLLAGKSPKIQVGKTPRSQIIAMLGEPSIRSADGRAVAYLYASEWNAWIEPLCFRVYAPERRGVALGVLFDEHDIVVDLDLREQTRDLGSDPLYDNPYDLNGIAFAVWTAWYIKPNIREKLGPLPSPWESPASSKPPSR